LEKLETMIAEAEGRNRSDVRASYRRDSRPRFAKPADDFDEPRPGSSRNQASFRKPTDDDFESRPRDRDRRSPDRSRHRRSPKRSRDRRSPERSRRSPDRSRDRKSPDQRFQRPRDDDFDQDRRRRPDFNRDFDLKGKFQKPRDDDDRSFSRPTGRNASTSSGSRGWKKKTEEPVKEEPRKEEESKPSTSRSSRKRSPSPSSSSSQSEVEEEPPAVEAPTLLTEKEMNEIGAKIVKAEILGNDVRIF